MLTFSPNDTTDDGSFVEKQSAARAPGVCQHEHLVSVSTLHTVFTSPNKSLLSFHSSSYCAVELTIIRTHVTNLL